MERNPRADAQVFFRPRAAVAAVRAFHVGRGEWPTAHRMERRPALAQGRAETPCKSDAVSRRRQERRMLCAA